jgi:hypothetical protein
MDEAVVVAATCSPIGRAGLHIGDIDLVYINEAFRRPGDPVGPGVWGSTRSTTESSTCTGDRSRWVTRSA